MSNFSFWHVLVCNSVAYLKEKGFGVMYIAVTGSKNNKDVYIYQSFRKKDGKSSSRIYKKLGKYNTLLNQFDGANEKLMAWAKSEAAKETELYNERTGKVTVEFSQAACIPMNEVRSFHAILTDLVYARVLSPSSKLSSYNFCKTLLEPPKYEIQDVYRALSVIAEESDFIQSELYKNSNFIHPRNQKILYYDCTNYYFEIEEESGLKHYGKGKENRPNPIVGMGLFMDADGIPLVFDVFPGNQNEQTTLKPLEKKIIKDFNCSEFIFCSDSGLGSANNRAFNSIGNRAYVITHFLLPLIPFIKLSVYRLFQFYHFVKYYSIFLSIFVHNHQFYHKLQVHEI